MRWPWQPKPKRYEGSLLDFARALGPDDKLLMEAAERLGSLPVIGPPRPAIPVSMVTRIRRWVAWRLRELADRLD